MWAVASGMLTGWLHTGLLTWERVVRGNLVWFSQDFIWQSPIAYTLLFLAAGGALAIVAAIRPKWVNAGVCAFFFTTLAVFGLLLPFPQIARIAALALAGGTGVAVARWVKGNPTGARRYSERFAVGLSLLTLGTAALTPGARALAERRSVAALPDVSDDAPNVLLIILDTVRAASLSLYGSPTPTTPGLERWATRSAVFDWAIAPAPWTLPTHASLFTGLAPHKLSAGWTRPLDRTPRTLAEVFSARGYLTVGITANHDYTAFDSGLDRGFQHYRSHRRTFNQLMQSSSYSQTELYDKLHKARSMTQIWRAISNPDLSIDPKHSSDRRTAELVTRPFLDWQQENDRRPFFAFLNYFDAHQAYYSPDDFPKVATGRGGRIAYENAIAWLDANVDTVLTTLDRRGALDNTIVIVTADHGELFGEHKLFGHAHNLYLNTVRVPLLIRFPRRIDQGVRISRTVSLTDLGATILDLAGIDVDFPGVSLSAALADSGAPVSEAVTEVRQAPNVNPIYPTAKGDLVAGFDDTWQLILNPDGKEQLFRYREDQRQDSDLSDRPEHVGPTSVLRERVRALRNGRAP